MTTIQPQRSHPTMVKIRHGSIVTTQGTKGRHRHGTNHHKITRRPNNTLSQFPLTILRPTIRRTSHTIIIRHVTNTSINRPTLRPVIRTHSLMPLTRMTINLGTNSENSPHKGTNRSNTQTNNRNHRYNGTRNGNTRSSRQQSLSLTARNRHTAT